MPDFEIDASQRFKGDFVLRTINAGQSASETRCTERVTELLLRFATDEQSDPNDKHFADLLDLAQLIRSDIANDLKGRVEKWNQEVRGAARDKSSNEVVEASHRLEGIYDERRLRLTEIPFTVVPVLMPGQSIYVDIEIRIRDVRISEDKQRFKIDIDRTLTVVRTVLSDRKKSWSRRISDALSQWWRRAPAPLKIQPKDTRLHEYVNALVGIASVGLMNVDSSQTPFAQMALNGLKYEFVAREAGVVKNAYVSRLGKCAGFAIIMLFGLYVASTSVWDGLKVSQFKNFFLLAAGTALGTWLSFSIRRVVLTFDDLAILEEDRLQPQFRIAFMIGITFVLGLLLWTKAIGLTIGNFTTDIAQSGAAAFLIGALSGIAERTMATAVSKRADEFAQRIGSTTKS